MISQFTARSRAFVLVPALAALTSCLSPAPVSLPSAQEVGSLRVTHREGSQPVEVVRTSEAERIGHALHILSELNFGWRHPSSVEPIPEYTASFHSQAGTVLVIAWVGPTWLGAATLGEAPRTTRLRPLTAAERETFLRALGIP
jgi:hypothetical protein